MTDYTQTTDFSAKDALISGDANKKIQGATIDTELSAISTAIASKADVGGDTYSGTHDFSSATLTIADDLITTAKLANAIAPRVLVADSGAVSSVATIDFDDVFTTDYDEYEVQILQMMPSASGPAFSAAFGNGSTYVGSGGSHAWGWNFSVINAVSGVSELENNSDTSMDLANSVGNGSGQGCAFKLYITNPNSTVFQSFVEGYGHYLGAAGAVRINGIAAHRTAVEDNTSIQFFFTSGNIASGRIRIYGLSHGSV